MSKKRRKVRFLKGRTTVFEKKVDTKIDTFDTKTRVERRKNGK